MQRKYRGSAEERADLLRHYAEFGGDMAKVFEWVMLSRPDADAHRFMAAINEAIAAGEAARTPAYARWAKETAARPPPKADPLAPEADGRAGGSGGGGKKKGGGKSKGGSGGGGDHALIAAIRSNVRLLGKGLGAVRDGGRDPGQSAKHQLRARLSPLVLNTTHSDPTTPPSSLANASKQGGNRLAATLASIEAKYGGGSGGGAKKGGGGKRKGGGKRGAGGEDGGSDDDEAGPEPTDEEFEAARRRLEERRAAAASGGSGGAKAGKAKRQKA